MASQARERLIEKAKPLFAKDDRYYINSGLDFLFLPLEDKAKIPTRWKQYLATWSVIFPLVLGVPLVIIPFLRMLPVPQHPILDTLINTGVIVWLMVYLVMPNYTRLIKKWLYN